MASADEVWRAAAKGLPLPPDCLRGAPSSSVSQLLQVATWNDHGPTLDALLDASINMDSQEPVDDALINMPLEHYGSLLALAARHGSCSAAAALLRAKACIDQVPSSPVWCRPCRPIEWAAAYGHEAVVRLLLESKAGLDVYDKMDALSFASQRGHMGVVSALLGANARIDTCRPCLAPLSSAAGQGHKDIVSVLLAAPAKPFKRNEHCGAALDAAAEKGHVAVMALLVEVKANVNATHGIYGGTPLITAAQCRYDAATSLLVAAKAHVDATDRHGRTALYLACRASTVTILVDAKASLDKANHEDVTPLCHLAEQGWCVDRARILLRAKADVNRRGHVKTPLSCAVRKGHEDVVRLLLEHKADMYQAVCGHQTPLICAAISGHASIVQAFVEKKADVNTVGPKQQTLLWYAAKAGGQYLVEFLLKQKADVDRADKERRTPLQVCARTNAHTCVAEVLLQHKANVAHLDRRRQTPLAHAAIKGSTLTARLLLEHKADIDSVNCEGRTPLLWAAMNGHQCVAETLVDLKADVNLADHDGHTPAWWAAKNQLPLMLQLLEG